MSGSDKMHILIEELLAQSHECEWLEFKENNFDKQETGEYISALANSAALLDKQKAYMVWGIQDGTHKVIGTSFKPHNEKIGAQALEMWLTVRLCVFRAKMAMVSGGKWPRIPVQNGQGFRTKMANF